MLRGSRGAKALLKGGRGCSESEVGVGLMVVLVGVEERERAVSQARKGERAPVSDSTRDSTKSAERIELVPFTTKFPFREKIIADKVVSIPPLYPLTSSNFFQKLNPTPKLLPNSPSPFLSPTFPRARAQPRNLMKTSTSSPSFPQPNHLSAFPLLSLLFSLFRTFSSLVLRSPIHMLY